MPAECAPRVRDTRFDSLRAVAIVAVVLGHAITITYGRATQAPFLTGAVFTLAAALGVPLFMFLSGWFAPKDADARWVGGRVTRLLLPYWAWGVVQYLLLHKGEGLAELFLLWTRPTETNAMWFLPALFLCSAAFALLRRWDPLLIAAAVAAVFLVPPVSVFDLPKAAEVFPYFVAGHYAARLRWDPRPAAVFAPVAVWFAWSGPGVALQWAAPKWHASWSAVVAGAPTLIEAAPLRLAHVTGPMALVAAALALAGIGWAPPPAAPPTGPLASAWRWLGLNTLGVYLAHIYFLRYNTGPGWLGVATSLAAALAGGGAITLLLSLWRPTARVFLGAVPGKPRPREVAINTR